MEGCYGRHGVPTIWAFCGVRGAVPAHVLFEAGGALVSRAVFRVLLGRFSRRRRRNLCRCVEHAPLWALWFLFSINYFRKKKK